MKKGFANNVSNMERLSSLQNKLSSSKQWNFSKIGKKLYDLSNTSKTYCSFFKKILTGKKVLCIPPIFHESKFITGFREKGCTILFSLCPSMLKKLNVYWALIGKERIE